MSRASVPARPLSAWLVLLSVLGACALPARTPAAPESVLLLPGASILTPGRQLADTMTYRLDYTLPQGRHVTGTARAETHVTADNGRPVLMLVQSTTSGAGSFVDTSFVAQEGFAPTRERSYAAGRQRQFQYDGARVRSTTLAPDSARSERAHVFDVPVFHFNEVDLLARAVPLRAGFAAIVPLYSQGDDAVERDTLRVIGRDERGVWSVRFADRVIVGTYGIDGATRRITSYGVRARVSTWHGQWFVEPR